MAKSSKRDLTCKNVDRALARAEMRLEKAEMLNKADPWLIREVRGLRAFQARCERMSDETTPMFLRGLGSADSVHTGDAMAYAGQSERLFRSAERSAKKGSCSASMKSMLRGAAAFGAYAVSNVGTSMKYYSHDVKSAQGAAKRAFGKHCKLAKKGK
jgi:hypothetical protein